MQTQTILTPLQRSDERALNDLSSEMLHVLKQEMEICRQMVGLLQEERESIKTLFTQDLESQTKRKTTLSLQLRILEESRISLVKEIAGLLGRGPEEINLSLLGQTLAEPFAEEFRQCQTTLKELSRHIEELNRSNASVLGQSLKQLKEYYRVITSFGTSYPTYQKNGKKGVLRKGKTLLHQHI